MTLPMEGEGWLEGRDDLSSDPGLGPPTRASYTSGGPWGVCETRLAGLQVGPRGECETRLAGLQVAHDYVDKMTRHQDFSLMQSLCQAPKEGSRVKARRDHMSKSALPFEGNQGRLPGG